MDGKTLLTPAGFELVRSLVLTAEEGFLLSRFSGPATVSEVQLASGMTEERALVVLRSLVEKGALQPDSEHMAKWGRFIFNEEELNEPVDIEPELRKEILFRYGTLATTSHWRVLGVEVDAPVAQVRLAYLGLSKVFHPDKYANKAAGSYKPKVRAIFERLTEAREVLSDDVERRRYEREGRGFTPEEKMALANLEINRLDREKRLRASRERLLRVKGFARLTKAREELRAGDRMLAQGDIGAAMGHYELALELDPRLAEAQAKIQEARRVERVRQADRAYEQGVTEETTGDFGAAVRLFLDASRLDASSARIAVATGRAMFRNAPKDPASVRVARSHVARGLELGNRARSTFLLHAEILAELGMKKLARQQLDLARDASDEDEE